MGQKVPSGEVSVLVLAILADAPCHGYAIAREIERRSGAELGVQEGALYPNLRTLEQNGLIAGAWDTTESGPARKVYTLTVEGQRELEKRARSWRDYARGFNAILGEQNG